MLQPRVFVSHCSADNAFTRVLVEDLENAGAEVWFDKNDIVAGDFVKRINAGLSKCEWFVLVLTPSALASTWVQTEVDAAIRLKNSGRIRELIIVQAGAVDDNNIPPLWAITNIFDAYSNAESYELALEQTLIALELRSSDKHIKEPERVSPLTFRIILIRIALVAAVLGVFAEIGIILSQSDGEGVVRLWADPIVAFLLVLAVLVLAIAAAYIRLMPLDASVSSKTRTAQLLFIALKQSRVRYEHTFDTHTLRAVIPLTVRPNDSSPDTGGMSISDAYQASRDLLVLGDSGCGKTTLLQQLALHLMDREIRETEITEQARRIPVLLPLHEWAERKTPLKSWIRRQFMHQFAAQGLLSVSGLSTFLVNRWIHRGQLILLLDGLDEMSEEDSRQCIVAINRLRQYTPSPIVITCAADRYARLAGDRQLLNVGQNAVSVQRVTSVQAQTYFSKLGATKLATWAREESASPDGHLPHTPLHLYILAQTYPDDSRNWEQPLDMSERALMKAYVKHALESEKALYARRDMRYWLTQFAVRLGNNPYFQFRAEDLPGYTAKALYIASTWLTILLVAGVVCVPFIIAASPVWQLLAVFALVAGLYGYLQLLPIVALIPGLYGFLLKSAATGVGMVVLYALTLALPFFAFASSGKRTRAQKAFEAISTFVVILLPVIVLTVALIITASAIDLPVWIAFLSECLIGGLLWYVSYKFRGMQRILQAGNKSSVLYTWLTVVYMMMARLIDPLVPNTLSPKSSTPRGMTKGLGVGVFIGFVIWGGGFLFWHTNLLLATILLGTSIWLDQGLGASLRGYLLRFWFWRFKMLPWSTRFLDDAVIAGLLEESGGSYRFVFRSALQNYLRGQAPSI